METTIRDQSKSSGSTNKKIKAIIFDFDGTIIDTETAWYVAFRDAYKKHGVDLTLEQYSQCIGTNLNSFNPYEYLITELNLPIDREEFRKSVQAHHSSLMEQEKMRPGIMDYLNLAKEAGLKIGLATSSDRAWIDKYLNQLGILDYFDCIRTKDDVKNVKPDPELYLQALACLGVHAEEAIAIEDSPNGAKAAMEAGLNTVVSPNATTRHLEIVQSHHRVECFSKLNLNDVIANPKGKLIGGVRS
ncbi:HAD family hydrolase [Paenibacillus beijingensis]|uniref:Phosphoglycolate phosphatase n=1 Tax=Paenibacillus beijingensis TaxID=1126833 RepID=A0A0D5NP01_9BACL|nr:HAD family hydrolase [Paenibacillus beijingensis]AJY77001.1 phosphoglycolate phosphatase [Paenibacillus beijingensis]